MKLYPLVLILGLLYMLFSITAALCKGISSTQISLIVHPDNPTASITAEKTRSYFLPSSNKTWPGNGRFIEALHRQADAKEYEVCCAGVLHMSSADVERYGSNRFSHAHPVLPGMDSDSAMIVYIAAIGYVTSATLHMATTAKVKVLLTLSK